jgi:hypothetical protein
MKNGTRTSSKPIVLLAATTRWVPTARLAIALANAGFTVEAVCPSRHPLCKTRVTRRIHAYRGLRPLHSFGDAIASARPDLIVPADDLATRQLHQLHQTERSNGKSGATICTLIERSLGAPESFPAMFARSKFMELVVENGILGPRTDVIADLDDVSRCAALAGFPLVLKADGTSGGRGVRIVLSLAEAESAFRTLSAPPTLLRAGKHALLDGDVTLLGPSLLRRRSVVNAQSFVQGREATSAIACWKGNILARLHFEVIEKAHALGHATVLRVVENKQMSVAAERIVSGLCLSGIIGLDFMLEGNSAKAHLIEINPRATQVGHLTLGLGSDLPAALYAAVSGEAIKPAPRVTENETITLFPQEWIRDAGSRFLSIGYHDVPWEEPELVQACVLSRRRQRRWYSRRAELQVANEAANTARNTMRSPAANHSNSHEPGVDAEGRILCSVSTRVSTAKEPT